MIAQETIFQNLFSLLSQTQLLSGGIPSGPEVFVTSSRRLPQVSNAGLSVNQPAIYQIEGEEEIGDKAFNLGRYDIRAAAVVFFRNTGGPNQVASTQMNGLRDAVVYQMTQQTLAADGVTVIPLLGGKNQTLGGVVYNARILGKVLKNEGIQNNQGAIIFPISILAGM
jgi:hypothetical protein